MRRNTHEDEAAPLGQSRVVRAALTTKTLTKADPAHVTGSKTSWRPALCGTCCLRTWRSTSPTRAALICGKSMLGKFLLKRKTRSDRLRARLREIKEALPLRRRQPIPEQGKWLRQVVRGYFAYHAVPTNFAALGTFHFHVTTLWWCTLGERSQRDKTRWVRMRQIARDWLPESRILHPWPSDRFAVKYPRWKPYAGKPHLRFCAGSAQ